jgi:hypothetical protein
MASAIPTDPLRRCKIGGDRGSLLQCGEGFITDRGPLQ